MTEFPLLSLIIFLPVAGVALLMLVRGDGAVRWLTLAVMVADFLLATWLLLRSG